MVDKPPFDERSIAVQLWIIVSIYVTTEVWRNGKYCVFGCRDQVPVASKQNTANHFSLFWGQPISWGCNGDTISEKIKWRDLVSANIR